jgi:signal peptidase I
MTWVTIFILMALPALSPGNQHSQKITATGSMEPAIQVNDLLIIDETYYSANTVKRFDVVVIERTADDSIQAPQTFTVVARVIALGGETIRIKNNRVFINGVALKEPYKIKPCSSQDAFENSHFPCSNFGPLKIPANEFFLLADNRGESEDGRSWKPHTIKKGQIKGKVVKVTRHL